MNNTSLYINPETKDYVNLNGQIENTGDIETEMYLRLTIPKRSYMYARNNPSLGSTLYQLDNTRGRVNKTQLKQIIELALQPMITARKINNLQIQIPRLVLGNVSIVIDCLDISGAPVHFVLNAII